MANRVLEVVVKVKDQASSKLKKFSGSVGGATKALKAMGVAAAVAGVAVIAAAVKMVDAAKKQVTAAIKLGDEYDKMGKRIDVSTESLSEWIFIIERAGGSSATLEVAFKSLITQMKGVKDGTKLSVDAFADLGVEVFDASGQLRNAEDVFNDTAKAISDLRSTTEQAAFATQLFGKGGLRLLPVLRQTNDELENQRELAKELGLVYSKEFTDGAAALNDALDLVRKTSGAAGREIVEAYGSDAAVLIEALTVEVKGLFDEFKDGGDVASDIMLDIASTMDMISNSIVPVVAGLDAIKQLGDVTTALVPGPAMVKGTIDAIKTLGKSSKKEINEAAEAVKFFQNLVEGIGPGAEDSTTRFVDALIARRLELKKLRDDAEAETGDGGPAPVVVPVVFEMQGEDPSGIDEGLFEELERLKIAREEASNADIAARLAGLDLYHDEQDALRKLADDQEEAYNRAVEVAEAMGRIGEETVQAFLRGENTMKAFGNAIKNEVINAIAAAIARMIVLKALMFFTGGIGGVKDGGTVGMASGGAARLVAGGQPGMDSVPALLMPGETVITRNDTQRLNNFLASFESSSMVDPATLSGGSSGAVSVSMNIARPVGYLDMLDLGDAAVVASQKLAEANL